MKITIVSLSQLLIICLTFSISVNAWLSLPQPRISENSGAQKDQALLLTTSIVDQKYCTGGNLRMTLQLHYTNMSNKPFILYKYSIAVFEALISSSEERASAKEYEEDLHYFSRIIGKGKPSDETVPSEDYTIIKPGDTFETNTYINISVDDGTDLTSGDIREGEHLLQVKVQTWYESQSLAVKLTEDWKKYGTLWLRSITSEPMPFRVEKERKFIDCP